MPPPRPSRGLVLVVDDDEGVRLSLRFFLEVEGFAVKDYATGGEFLNEPQVVDASCLVVDYNLPDMTGLDVVRRIRARGIRNPAVIITGASSESLRKGAAAAGISIVEKPHLGAALINNIQHLCDGAK
jgi:two-component system response regulator FixJ